MFLLKSYWESTCELLLAAIPHARLKVLQLDLYFLVVPHGLFALSPDKSIRLFRKGIKKTKTGFNVIQKGEYEGAARMNNSIHLPVNEHYDEHNKSHYGGPNPDSDLSLQRESGLGLSVVLNSAQREV